MAEPAGELTVVKEHRWVVASDCRRGRACDGRKLLGAVVLACWDCRTCWTCAGAECSARRRPGFPEYQHASYGSAA